METVESWAKFITRASFKDIPKDAVSLAVEHVIDTIGVILAGSGEPIGKIVTEYIHEEGGTPEAGVLGGGFKTAITNACFANGIMGHCMDYDDSWVVRGHPSVVVLPATLALAEKVHASGKSVLEAYVIALEVMARVPMNMNDLFHRGWHPSAVWGVIGSCAAAAKLLDLDVEQIQMGMGIATSTSAGLHKNRGTMAKSFHAGNANRSGLQAAILAQKGFTADPNIMEGAEGFSTAFAGEGNYDLEKMGKDLGKPWLFTAMKPGLCIKKYPCGFSFHWALDAALYLVKTHNIKAKDVANVEVGVRPQKAYATDTEVSSRLRAKFSMEYLISAAIVDGQISRHTFDEDRVRNPEVRSMMPKITLKEYPLPPEYPIIRCNPVTITLKDGARLSHRVEKPYGYPDSPITREQLLFKYRDCASVALPEDKIEESITLLEDFTNLQDVSPLMRLLTGGMPVKKKARMKD